MFVELPEPYGDGSTKASTESGWRSHCRRQRKNRSRKMHKLHLEDQVSKAPMTTSTTTHKESSNSQTSPTYHSTSTTAIERKIPQIQISEDSSSMTAQTKSEKKKLETVKTLSSAVFLANLQKKEKIECWKAIHQKCTSLGLVAPDKDWTYCRDVFWQNVKKATLKKVDNRRKTGSAGGTDCKYTEIDNIVLDILGHDNPIISSLGVTETWEQKHADCSFGDANNTKLDNNLVVEENSVTTQVIVNKNHEINTETLSGSATISGVEKVDSSTKKKRIMSHINETAEDSLNELKKKKMLLQTEILQKENYLKSLEILKLERELQVPSSKFTEEFSSLTYFINIEEAPVQESAVLAILGGDPATAKLGSYRLHKAVCTRWEHILTNGLSKEKLLELHARHVIPDNCPLLAPPKINPEIELALTAAYITQDRCHQRFQNQISGGLRALGKDMNTLLERSADASTICPNDVLPHLVDAGRIFTDLFHDVSITRLQLITQTLSKTKKDTAGHTKSDEFLFGRDFEEKSKAAKSLEKISKDMRAANSSGKTFALQKRGGGSNTPLGASLVPRPEKHLNRKRSVHQRREMKPFRGQHPPRMCQLRSTPSKAGTARGLSI
nr:unnamed protein product [Callosobruchus analis]